MRSKWQLFCLFLRSFSSKYASKMGSKITQNDSKMTLQEAKITYTGQKWPKKHQKWLHFPILISGKWPPPFRSLIWPQNHQKVRNHEVYPGKVKFKREIPILNRLGAPKYWGGVPPMGSGVSFYPSRRSKSHQKSPHGVDFGYLESFSSLGDRFLASRRSKRADLTNSHSIFIIGYRELGISITRSGHTYVLLSDVVWLCAMQSTNRLFWYPIAVDFLSHSATNSVITSIALLRCMLWCMTIYYWL